MSTLPQCYQDLTPQQKAAMCNGCGDKNRVWILRIPVPLPKVHLREPCNQHDYAYSLGGTEADRRAADHEFLARMHSAVRAKLPWWRQPIGYVLAYVYYRTVRAFAASHFSYRDAPMSCADWLKAYAPQTLSH